MNAETLKAWCLAGWKWTKAALTPIYWWLRKRFEVFLEPANENSKANLYHLFLIAGAFCVIILLAAIIVALVGVGQGGGTFGDFIGGTLNPILTFLTFMALLITIVLQQKELAETRKELAASARALEDQHRSLDRQNFETTFFQMLTLHNTIVNSIDLFYSGRESNLGIISEKAQPRETKGRDCFKQFYTNYTDAYNSATGQNERKRLQAAYDEFWEKRQQDLAHYYRYLYNVLRFVYDYQGIDDKLRYVKLLRAQLSDYELVMLFYTALNKNGMNYWIYIHEYELFDNLPPEMLLEPVGHKALYSRHSFGEPKKPKTLDWPPYVVAEKYETEKAAKAAEEAAKAAAQAEADNRMGEAS
ncbi:putative phage abortive infection protein [Pararhizobium sp. O133]|uniref:putative phage abortive infection protein n=1 Tax=Pararhizobium sp. O133 TaxID=3449278 RepID=UPI003F6837D2